MNTRTISLIIALLTVMVITGFFTVSAAEPGNSLQLQIVNRTDASISNSEIVKAYQDTLERYRKILPASRLAMIDNNKIEAIYVVEQISRPEVSKAGLTQALVDLETGEVESITIEVRNGYRHGLKSMSFKSLLEHEFAHAFAFMAGLPQAQEIGHSIQVEQVKVN